MTANRDASCVIIHSEEVLRIMLTQGKLYVTCGLRVLRQLCSRLMTYILFFTFYSTVKPGLVDNFTEWKSLSSAIHRGKMNLLSDDLPIVDTCFLSMSLYVTNVLL